MVKSYNELLKMKNNGIKLVFDDITKEQLSYLFIYENLPNSVIADLYDVSASKIKYKRKKWGISVYSSSYFYEKYVKENEQLNNSSKDRLMGEENIDLISKALTHYIFRNGPVENMHADGKLSQEDMKTLNKYMVNRIAGILKLINDGEWFKIELMLNSLINYGTEWDKIEYDTKEIDDIFLYEFKRSIGK